MREAVRQRFAGHLPQASVGGQAKHGDVNNPSGQLLNVLVATDGSAGADCAVDWAAAEAMRRSGWLLVLTARAIEATDRSALDIVDRAADRVRRHFPGLKVDTKVVETDPREALAELQSQASLVVVGSRGRNALRTVWLGSVAYWAARHLQVPVAIVRPLSGAHDEVLGRIAVGVDTQAAATTLRAAFEMAAHRRCSVTIGHAWWDIEDADAGWSSVAPELVESARRHLVHDLVRRVAADYPDVGFEVRFARGSVGAFLLDLARTHDALVIGRRKTAPFDDTGLGTVATVISEHARGVTVVVPPTTSAADPGRR